MDAFNKLSHAEAERLAILAEELGEAIQVIGKILRHGYENHHPSSSETNRESLQRELGDVLRMIEWASDVGDVSASSIQGHAKAKREMSGTQKFLHHQTERDHAPR